MLPLIALAAMMTTPPAPLEPIPSPRQWEWQKLGAYAFVHFGPNTFTGEEWGHGNEPETIFNPKKLDCRQWARTFKAAGLKGIVITAKHHDGFCLWPSKYSTHTVAQSHWKDGKGDVLRELSNACKAEGLKFGVYLSPWDRNHPTYGTPEYNETFQNMLREVLNNYGPVFEVWFDGANGEGPNGKRQVYDWPQFILTTRVCQPNAVIFSDAGPDIRWVGNEAGHSAPTCWSTIDASRYVPGTPLYAELTEGKEGGSEWVPAECDVSIRPGWFHRDSEDGKVKSPEELMRIWEESVGQNASLILNVPPNSDGLISQPDVDSLLGWRKLMDATYKVDLAKGAKATSTASRGGGFEASRVVDGRDDSYWAAPDDVIECSLTLDLPKAATFDRVDLREQIALGQRISGFTVEAETAEGWKPIGIGTTVGNRRILRVPRTTAKRVRLNILSARACPTLTTFALHNTPEK